MLINIRLYYKKYLILTKLYWNLALDVRRTIILSQQTGYIHFCILTKFICCSLFIDSFRLEYLYHSIRLSAVNNLGFF